MQCRLGLGESCVALAYSAEKDSTSQNEAQALYLRACDLGLANACTNYAASIWVGTTSAEQNTCARRTFESACLANEQFACGMVGRVMVESTEPPPTAEARRYLETSCDRIGGFSCRVLAKYLEAGKLGDYQPGLIASLLGRACVGGDPDACGTHATAAETFQ